MKKLFPMTPREAAVAWLDLALQKHLDGRQRCLAMEMMEVLDRHGVPAETAQRWIHQTARERGSGALTAEALERAIIAAQGESRHA
jgi:hypothetical protein